MIQEQRVGPRMLRTLADGLCDVSVVRCSRDLAGRGRCLQGPASLLGAGYLLAQNEAKVRLGVWLFPLPWTLLPLGIGAKVVRNGSSKERALG